MGEGGGVGQGLAGVLAGTEVDGGGGGGAEQRLQRRGDSEKVVVAPMRCRGMRQWL